MDTIRQLADIAIKAHNGADLPLEILAEINALIAEPSILTGKESHVKTLMTLIEEYDPYAGVGCFGGGSSLDEIRKALRALKV